MSRWRWTIVVVAFAAVLATGPIWSTQSRTAKIRYHRKALMDAHDVNFGQPQGFVKAFWRSFRRESTVESQDEASIHEQALISLGYFTNLDLRLSDGTVTKEFRSSFFWRIRDNFGTNSATHWRVSVDHVWVMRALPDGEEGIRATVPVNDAADWQRIFAEFLAQRAANRTHTNK